MKKQKLDKQIQVLFPAQRDLFDFKKTLPPSLNKFHARAIDRGLKSL